MALFLGLFCCAIHAGIKRRDCLNIINLATSLQHTATHIATNTAIHTATQTATHTTTQTATRRTLLRFCAYETDGSIFRKHFGFRQKTPYVSTKEHCVFETKKLQISANEPLACAKMVYISRTIFAKELRISLKEPYVYAKEPSLSSFLSFSLTFSYSLSLSVCIYIYVDVYVYVYIYVESVESDESRPIILHLKSYIHHTVY